MGAGYVFANPDYSPKTFKGPYIYASFDFKKHWGIGAEFHQATSPEASHIYERTYEIGGRYVRHYGRYQPYLKANIGRGVFNYPFDVANLAYNMFALGGGLDVHVHRHINVRGDFEWQRWGSFPVNGLQPTLLSFGAAYHF